MNKLSKEKRNQLIIILMVTVLGLAGVGFFIIKPQYKAIADIEASKKEAQAKLQLYRDTIKKGDSMAAEITEINFNLLHAEEDMASGDLYAWTYDTIRHFKQTYRVEIPAIGQPILGDVDVLPLFPYKQIKITVSGSAFYHDLGKFLSDLENNFPHMRVVNLNVESSSGNGAETQKLNFRMDLIALVKSNS
jgi:flagellar basal body-associated protein FliL